MTDLIRDMFQAIDLRRWDALPDFFDVSARYERPGYPIMTGLAEILHFYTHVRVIASGEHRIEGLVMSESSGACWGTYVGTSTTGASIDERFADIYEFANGKVVYRRSHFFRPAI